MNNRQHREQIQRLLEVMTFLAPYGWGLLLAEMEKRIGPAALQKIVELTYRETEARKREDLRRALASAIGGTEKAAR